VEFALNEFINSAPDMWSLAPEPEAGHVVFVLTESQFESRFIWDGAAYVADAD
jgi:hypothetical protein